MGYDIEPMPEARAVATLSARLPKEVKNEFKAVVRSRSLTIENVLSQLVREYIASLTKPREKKTGRGNKDTEQLDLVKEYIRNRHPIEVRAIEVSEYLTRKQGEKVSQARATRLLDILSGGIDGLSGQEFLVGMNDDEKPTTYFIFKDAELGIEPW
jgi:antitoxin component of RelBE/YafQ-DinJ toxin-antitoxin module